MSRQRLAILLSSGAWEELDESTELVLCTEDALREAQRSGRQPQGLRLGLMQELAKLKELLEP